MFYINEMDRTPLDLEFGCPYGCDNNGIRIRNIGAEVKRVVERSE
jgi:hypothetical protein